MRNRSHWVIFILIMLVGLGMAPQSQADEPTTCYRVPRLMFHKLGRGISNLAFGWMEIPQTMHQEFTTSQDQAVGFFGGLTWGSAKAIGRTIVGGHETLTFLLPIPPYYTPILPPLAYFDTKSPKTLPLQ